jgi:sulfoxide reductase catalytic subunit YedY
MLAILSNRIIRNKEKTMEKRRHFIKSTLRFCTGMGIVLSPFFQAVRIVYAKAQKIILPKDTDRRKLRNMDPAQLDTRNLAPTLLKDFETMGDTGYTVNLDAWHLEVGGHVGTPLSLSYSQLIGLPPIERNVLLICPGFFAYVGRWKGISLGTLIEKAQMQKDVTHVTLSATRAAGGNEEKFPVEDILSDKVFLAFGVNGQTLPKKHGFPLRAVAEGYHGSVWVKYVNRVKLE